MQTPRPGSEPRRSLELNKGEEILQGLPGARKLPRGASRAGAGQEELEGLEGGKLGPARGPGGLL